MYNYPLISLKMIAFLLFLEASEPSKNFYKSKLVYCLNIFTAVTLRVEPNFVVFLIEKERRRFCLNRFMPWKCEHSFTEKPTLITEPAVPALQRTTINPVFETVFQQHATHTQQRPQSIHAVFVEDAKIKQAKERLCLQIALQGVLNFHLTKAISFFFFSLSYPKMSQLFGHLLYFYRKN